MRIVHAANFNNNKYGADLYSTDRKISAGMIRNGHFVYDFSYRDVCRNESLFRTTRLGTNTINKKLIEACDVICPDLLLLGHTELIAAATLQAVKDHHPAARIGMWYVDALFNREKTAHIFSKLDSIDVFFATTGGEYLREFATSTTTAAFIPNMVDPAVESGCAFKAKAYVQDLVFCGRDTNDAQRHDFMARLNREVGKYMRCVFKGCLGNPPVTGAAYLDFLSRSKMGLNISRQNDVPLYSSDRLTQLVGNGLLTFCPEIPGMDGLFGDDELVYFTDLDDLLEKVLYYHINERECRAIAARGWQRAHGQYNNKRVTAYMLEVLCGNPFSSDYEWQNTIFRSSSLQNNHRLQQNP